MHLIVSPIQNNVVFELWKENHDIVDLNIFTFLEWSAESIKKMQAYIDKLNGNGKRPANSEKNI